MEDLNKDQTVGIVKISDEVVSVIAGIAAEEIDGVVGFQHGVSSIFKGKKNLGKTVKVTLNENSAIIEMAVSVEENIKRTVEAMTGLSVEAVDIYVQNIYMPKKEEEEISEN